MHIAFTVPLWAMIGFGTIAYPSIGAMIASFLMRASGKRLPGWLVFSSGAAWPVTLSGAIAAFPVWLAIWLVRNYGQAVVATLRGNGPKELGVSFEYNASVKLIRALDSFVAGAYGTVKDTKPGYSFVEFPTLGNRWVPNDSLARC